MKDVSRTETRIEELMKTLYTCPVCASTLEINGNQYICKKNHQYDMAKEGYVNLLLASQKNSKEPGDSKEMINARRDFLSKGYYDELIKAIATTISESKCKSLSIMDMGCGDGYFIHKINSELTNKGLKHICIGIDISKAAVRAAAKLDKYIKFAVASSFNLPVGSEELDFIIRMFAPGDDKEVVRCLKNKGYLITVTPGPYHLYNLREVVYQTPRLHEDRVKKIVGLEQKFRQSISYTIDINNKDDLRNLLTMTPYYWNGDNNVKEKFDTLSGLTTKVDFVITFYQKIDN